MTANPRVFRNSVWDAGTKFPRARLTDRNDDVLTQASFTGTVRLSVWDISGATPNTAVLSTTRTVAATVHNSLQQWSIDADGYNFSDSITSNEVDFQGGHTYRLSYLLTHATEGLYPVVFDVRVEPLISA